MAMRTRAKLAEGSILTLMPVLENKYGQKVYVAKNPASWRTNYSVWADCGREWSTMLASHHKTKKLAVAAAKRLRSKNVLRFLGWVK